MSYFPKTNILLLLIGSFSIIGCSFDSSKEAVKIRNFQTNESIIEDIRHQELNFEDIDGVFKSVFFSLNDTVKVYPTENYYYFRFYSNKGDVWGNIRLDSLDRERGELSFAYFYVNPNRSEPYYGESKSWHKFYNREQGLEVKKIDKLVYEVSYQGETKTFHLNNVEQVLPSQFRLHPSEELAARICDESGFQFYLIFNRNTKGLYYILDETIPTPDVLRVYGKDILLGQLSEFAFYDEPNMNRKVLFAIAEKNVKRNNYYDGPFDQLADNFVDTTKFQNIIEEAYPGQKGKVSGRGDFINENGERNGIRLAISRYATFQAPRDIWGIFVQCDKQKLAPPQFLDCLTNYVKRVPERASQKPKK